MKLPLREEGEFYRPNSYIGPLTLARQNPNFYNNSMMSRNFVTYLLTYLLTVCLFLLVFCPAVFSQSVPGKVARQVVAAQRVKRAGDLSVCAYFHQLSRGVTFPMPDWADGPAPKPISSSFSKRSLESLRHEAAAMDMPPLALESFSREELEEWINTVRQWQRVARKEVASRYEAPAGVTWWYEEARLRDAWAETQPDFDPNNYLEDKDRYLEPVHPSVKSLRILVITNNYAAARFVDTPESNELPYECDIVTTVNDAYRNLNNAQKPYDAILVDSSLSDGEGFSVGMYVWNKQIKTSVILFSTTTYSDTFLLAHNIVGRVFPPAGPFETDYLINYLTNMVATGHAYPNGKEEIEEDW